MNLSRLQQRAQAPGSSQESRTRSQPSCPAAAWEALELLLSSMRRPHSNPFIKSSASYSPRLHQPRICISNNRHPRLGCPSAPAARNRSTRTLPTPRQKDLECFPAESHHPQSISCPGRELLSATLPYHKRYQEFQPQSGINRVGRDGEGDVSNPAPIRMHIRNRVSPSHQEQGHSLKGKALRKTKAKASASLFQAPGPARGKMPSPGAWPQAAASPGSPKQPSSACSTGGTQIHSSNDFQEITRV